MYADFGDQKPRLSVAERDRRRHILLIALTVLFLVIAQEILTQWTNQPNLATSPPVQGEAVLISVPASN